MHLLLLFAGETSGEFDEIPEWEYGTVPVWQQAEVINDFKQYDLFTGQQPFALTEMRIIYDNDFIYVA